MTTTAISQKWAVVSQAVQNNVHTASGWMANHKIVVASTATTTALAVAAIAGSILTGGIAGIVIGAVLGGASLACGTVTGIKCYQDVTHDRELAWANKQCAATDIQGILRGKKEARQADKAIRAATDSQRILRGKKKARQADEAAHRLETVAEARHAEKKQATEPKQEIAAHETRQAETQPANSCGFARQAAFLALEGTILVGIPCTVLLGGVQYLYRAGYISDPGNSEIVGPLVSIAAIPISLLARKIITGNWYSQDYYTQRT